MGWSSYPTAPVSMDMRSTGIVGSSRNFESIIERPVKGIRPSIWSDGIFLAESIFVRMSRVDRHDVKTMLDVLWFNGCSYRLVGITHLFESISKHDRWILSMTARSLEECPSGIPNGDRLGEATEKGLDVEGPLDDSPTLRKLEEDVKDLSVHSWNEEVSESASHRPHTGQASNPFGEVKVSPSLALHNSQNVSPAILDCGFFDLGCLTEGVGELDLAIIGAMVPWLQSLRSFMIVVKRTLYLLRSDDVLTILSNSAWQSARIPLYIAVSSEVKTTGTTSVITGGKLRYAPLLRRQTTRRSSLRFRNESSDSDRSGSTICCSKNFGLENGSKWINFRRDLKSSKLFWIGVPVKHHLLSAWRFSAALNSWVDWFRIQCAVSC